MLHGRVRWPRLLRTAGRDRTGGDQCRSGCSSVTTRRNRAGHGLHAPCPIPHRGGHGLVGGLAGAVEYVAVGGPPVLARRRAEDQPQRRRWPRRPARRVLTVRRTPARFSSSRAAFANGPAAAAWSFIARCPDDMDASCTPNSASLGASPCLQVTQ